MDRNEQILLAETAALAGELMLSSGAETFRAEDTMAHILQKGTSTSVTPLALTTSILVTLEDPNYEPLTIVRRIPSGSTNLGRIARINELSRDFCEDKISLQEIAKELKHLKKYEYKRFLYNLATIGVCTGFALFFGGTYLDALAAVIIGLLQAVLVTITKKFKLTGFLMTGVTCACMAILCALLKDTLLPTINTDIVIVSCIMPLVPGVAITNAIRDTLQGDYISGSARTLEAFLKAASIGVGAGIGMMIYGLL